MIQHVTVAPSLRKHNHPGRPATLAVPRGFVPLKMNLHSGFGIIYGC